MRSTERRDRQVRDFKNSSGSEPGTEVKSGTEAQRQSHLGGERGCDFAGVRQRWSAKGHGIDLADGECVISVTRLGQSEIDCRACRGRVSVHLLREHRG